MKKETRFKFNSYLMRLADIYEVPVEDFSSKVDVLPSVAQTLEDNIQQSAAFLGMINIVPVPDKNGSRIGLGIGSSIAGTTDTKAQERRATDPSELTEDEYECTKTNYDTAISYEKLDLWAKFKDFQARIRNHIIRRQALDRIMIGFNGTHRAKTSDREKYKRLEDVNTGWLEKVRQFAKEHAISDVRDADDNVISPVIRVGEGGDFENLDALVMNAVDNLIDEEYQDDTGLVVICGRKLLSDKYFPIVNKKQENSEALAADVIISQKRVGGLPAVRAPYFPDNTLFITRLDNLSIYWQEESRRRHIIDNPKCDQIEDYESVNESFVVEDYRGTALVGNIKILEPVKPNAPETPAEETQDGK